MLKILHAMVMTDNMVLISMSDGSSRYVSIHGPKVIVSLQPDDDHYPEVIASGNDDGIVFTPYPTHEG